MTWPWTLALAYLAAIATLRTAWHILAQPAHTHDEGDRRGRPCPACTHHLTRHPHRTPDHP